MDKIKNCMDCKELRHISDGECACGKYSVVVIKGNCPTSDYLVCQEVAAK